MDKTRRSFLRGSGISVLNNRRDRRPAVPVALAGDLTPYEPRPGKEWNEQRARHLLHRAGFGATPDEIRAALASTPQAIVSAMLQAGTTPSAPGAWATENPKSLDNTEISRQYGLVRDLQEWWYNLMITPQNMLREKMVLFWHNHFVSEFLVVYWSQLLYRQNQLFRQYAFGDFKALTQQVTIDPAMLIYLNGNTNFVGRPNENYAREVMELFTLGVGNYTNGTPHYTEQDIIELARALTGWRDNGVNQPIGSYFTPARFDTGNKTILGSTGNFGIQGKGQMDAIDLLFSVNDTDLNQKRAAVFICTKLYHFFVYEGTADETIIKGMAQTLEANNWNIGPVLQQLLTSEHFFDDNVMGAKIKSPAEYVVGSVRTFGLTPQMARNSTNSLSPETHDPLTAMMYQSQWLFYAPNVKGWVGGRAWISSSTAPLRIRYSKLWVEPIGGGMDYKFNAVNFIKSMLTAQEMQQLGPAQRAHLILDRLISYLLPLSISDSVKATLLSTLLKGGPDYEWDEDKFGTGVVACLVALTKLGEFQLT